MFPLQPVLPKKIPLALASRRASSSTVLIFVWNFSRSCGRALKAWTVRSAASDSCATYVRVTREFKECVVVVLTLFISPRASCVWFESFLR